MDCVVVVFVEQNLCIMLLDVWCKVDELFFDFVCWCFLVIFEGKDGEYLLVCKGVVEEMFEIVICVYQDGVDLLFDEECCWVLLVLVE